jgi:hypothetical protein
MASNFHIAEQIADGKYKVKSGVILTEEQFKKLKKLQGGFWLILITGDELST